MKTPILLLALVLGSPALAADDDVTIERTTITQGEVEPSKFKDEAFGIKPQFGLTTREVGVDSDPHGVIGVLFDFNFLARGKTEEGAPWVGLTFGGLYSHLGSAGSDFLGLNGAEGIDESDMVQIPLNVKAGYTFSDT